MFEQGCCWEVSDALWRAVVPGTDVKFYSGITAERANISIRQEESGGEGEVAPLSKKASVMTPEPFSILKPPILAQPPALRSHLLIHCCHDNSDLSPPCLGSYICYQLNGQQLSLTPTLKPKSYGSTHLNLIPHKCKQPHHTTPVWTKQKKKQLNFEA